MHKVQKGRESTSSTRKSARTDIAARVTKSALGSDSELQQKLEQAETARREAKTRAERAEDGSTRMEDRLQLAKIEVSKWLEDKDNLIKKLHRQLVLYARPSMAEDLASIRLRLSTCV